MAQQLEHLKWIQGTAFMVDGFRFQNPRCTKYFLTHFHADHTTGGLTAVSANVAAQPAEQVVSELFQHLQLCGRFYYTRDEGGCPGCRRPCSSVLDLAIQLTAAHTTRYTAAVESIPAVWPLPLHTR